MPSPSPKEVPFLRGDKAVLRIFMDAGSGLQEVTVRFKTWKIAENVTEFQDDVGGEPSSRVGHVHNFHEISGDAFYRDATILRAWLADTSNEQAGAAPLPKQATFKAVARDGSKIALTYSGTFDLGPSDISMGSRQDALMQAIKIRVSDSAEGRAS